MATRSGPRSSPRSPPAARITSGSSSQGRAESIHFDQEQPESLWIGRRQRQRDDSTRLRHPASGGGGVRHAPWWASPGLSGLLQRLRVRDVCGDQRGGARRRIDYPTVLDGLRAAKITEAVLESARRREWVECAMKLGLLSRSQGPPSFKVRRGRRRSSPMPIPRRPCPRCLQLKRFRLSGLPTTSSRS